MNRWQSRDVTMTSISTATSELYIQESKVIATCHTPPFKKPKKQGWILVGLFVFVLYFNCFLCNQFYFIFLLFTKSYSTFILSCMGHNIILLFSTFSKSGFLSIVPTCAYCCVCMYCPVGAVCLPGLHRQLLHLLSIRYIYIPMVPHSVISYEQNWRSGGVSKLHILIGGR